MLETPKAILTKTEDENLNGNGYESRKERIDDSWFSCEIKPKNYIKNGQSATKSAHYNFNYNNRCVHRLSRKGVGFCYNPKRRKLFINN